MLIIKKILCNFLVWTLQYLKNIYFWPWKHALKNSTLYSPFFSVLPTGPKLKFCSKKIAHHARVMYNDFACSSSGHWWVSETTTWAAVPLVARPMELLIKSINFGINKVNVSPSTNCKTWLTHSIIGDDLAAAILAESNISWTSASLANLVLM